MTNKPRLAAHSTRGQAASSKRRSKVEVGQLHTAMQQQRKAVDDAGNDREGHRERTTVSVLAMEAEGVMDEP